MFQSWWFSIAMFVTEKRRLDETSGTGFNNTYLENSNTRNINGESHYPPPVSRDDTCFLTQVMWHHSGYSHGWVENLSFPWEDMWRVWVHPWSAGIFQLASFLPLGCTMNHVQWKTFRSLVRCIECFWSVVEIPLYLEFLETLYVYTQKHPLVMTNIAMARSTIYSGKAHYFYCQFNCYVTNYQRVYCLVASYHFELLMGGMLHLANLRGDCRE